MVSVFCIGHESGGCCGLCFVSHEFGQVGCDCSLGDFFEPADCSFVAFLSDFGAQFSGHGSGEMVECDIDGAHNDEFVSFLSSSGEDEARVESRHEV